VVVQKGLTAKKIAERLYEKLKENCNNKDTIEYLKSIAAKGW
jgi:hypothetical protein